MVEISRSSPSTKCLCFLCHICWGIVVYHCKLNVYTHFVCPHLPEKRGISWTITSSGGKRKSLFETLSRRQKETETRKQEKQPQINQLTHLRHLFYCCWSLVCAACLQFGSLWAQDVHNPPGEECILLLAPWILVITLTSILELTTASSI